MNLDFFLLAQQNNVHHVYLLSFFENRRATWHCDISGKTNNRFANVNGKYQTGNDLQENSQVAVLARKKHWMLNAWRHRLFCDY